MPKSGTRSRKPTKDPAEPKAWQLYAKAFVEGHAAAGGTVIPPTEAEATQIGRAAAALAKYTDGSPIVGADLLTWIRRRACKFREDVSEPDKHSGGWSARGLVHWLNNGHHGRPWPTAEERAREERARAKAPPSPTLTLGDRPRPSREEGLATVFEYAPHLRPLYEAPKAADG